MKPGSTKKKEYKLYLAGEFKATNDKEGIIEGYINAIGNIDDGDDRTMSGAFKRTINAAYARKAADSTLDFLWPYLWNHDYNQLPPGGIFDASEEKKGLFTKVQLNLDMNMGRDMYSSFKMGTLRKQSMGYICHKSEMVKEGDKWVRNLLEIEMLEGSAVVFPMNQDASVTGVKSGVWTPQQYWQGHTTVKGKAMNNQPQKKDFNSHFADAAFSDWKDDWYDLTSALRQAAMDAFSIGDQPVEDAKAALDQFGTAFLAWIQDGIDCDASEYIADQQSNPYGYGYMSASNSGEHKAGGMSQSKKDTIQTHIDTINQAADDHLKTAKQHSKALHSAADDLATVLQGSEAAYGTDPGTPEKSNSPLHGYLEKDHSSSVDTDLDAAMAQLDLLKSK